MNTKDLIKVLGIMPKVKGHFYISDAVDIIRSNKGEPIFVTKDIYPFIAMRYDTSTECVEHAIRTSINNAWIHNKKLIDRIAGYTLRFKPSNKEFLIMIADYIDEVNERSYLIKI